MRTLVKLVIAGLVVHASWRTGSAYWTYFNFREGLREVAQLSANKPEEEVHRRAMAVASKLNVPIAPEQLIVTRREEHTFIDASYKTEIEVLPRYRYPWEFEVIVDAWTINGLK